MQHPHSTGSTGIRNNVYRLDNAPAVLRSRKPRNSHRTWIKRFCKLSPKSRLRVCKAYGLDATQRDCMARSSVMATFLLHHGLSRDLLNRFERAKEEAWALEEVEIPVAFSASELARLKPLARARRCSVEDLAQQLVRESLAKLP